MANHRTYAGYRGLRLVADVAGDPRGAPIVLLHGGGQTRRSWKRAVSVLAERGYFVVNFDARGHGDSDWCSAGDYTHEAMAADLRAVVATLPSAPALVGASMGGVSSLLALGGVSPPPARALVLVDIVPRMDPRGVERILTFMRAHRDGFASLEEAAQAVAAYNAGRRGLSSGRTLMHSLRTRNGRLFWHWDPAFLDRGRSMEDLQLLSHSLEECARRVTAPSLLVRGLLSDVVSNDGVASLLANMPHVELHDIVGAGHMIAGDKNDAFCGAMLAFLERHHRA